MYDEVFASRLELLMKQKGINETELASEIGVPETTIHSLLKGDLSCGADVLVKLMDFFQVTGEYLFGRSDDSKKC